MEPTVKLPLDTTLRVGWDKMSIVGQSESDDVFVSCVTVKKLMITGLSVLLSYSNWKIKKIDVITMGYLIFGRQIKIPSDLLCPIILILPILPYQCLFTS